MRIVLAAIYQLTNSFRRQPTIPTDFLIWDPLGDVSSRVGPPHQLVDAIVARGRENGVEVVPALLAWARPAGPATEEAATMLLNRLGDALRKAAPNVDALILLLSGSLLDQTGRSVDARLVEVARQSVPTGVPLVAMLSKYANPNEDLIDASDLVVTGNDGGSESADALAAKTLSLTVRLVRQEIHPVSAMSRLPLLMPLTVAPKGTSRMTTVRGMALEFEQRHGVLSVSIFEGFPYADSPDTGAGVLVTVERDGPDAGLLAERLTPEIWDIRQDLQAFPANVETVIHDAMLDESRRVVILDAGDDPRFGASGDGTGLLWALIDLGARDAALGVIVDARAVQHAIAAGVGNATQLDLGGSLDRRAGYPIPVNAVVRRITDGRRVFDGGNRVGIGRSAVLAVDGRHGGIVETIICEQTPPFVDARLFTSHGIDLPTKKIVAVKSSGEARESFSSIASRILETSTPGITTPVLVAFDYQRIRRPIYPLDPL